MPSNSSHCRGLIPPATYLPRYLPGFNGHVGRFFVKSSLTRIRPRAHNISWFVRHLGRKSQ